MVEVAQTSDPVRLGYLQSALTGAGIKSVAFDSGVGSLWPSGVMPRRLMVDDKDAWRARQVIEQAETAVDR